MDGGQDALVSPKESSVSRRCLDRMQHFAGKSKFSVGFLLYANRHADADVFLKRWGHIFFLLLPHAYRYLFIRF